MSDEQKPSSGPFDVETVQQLVRLMRKFDLSEMSLQDGDRRVRLRRGTAIRAEVPVAFAPATVPSYAAPTSAASGPGSWDSFRPAAAISKLIDIKSPMVGTFYSKPAPDKDDYVKVGARVAADTVVCKIEAMKIFNDLPAGCSGTIAEICVQNAQFVEYDDVLFRVEPS